MKKMKGMDEINKILEINNTNDKEQNIEEILVREAIRSIGDPFKNLTVKDVAKDLKMGENLTNELFRRKDFPSVNIGKTKTVCALAYIVWKMKHKESGGDNDEKAE